MLNGFRQRLFRRHHGDTLQLSGFTHFHRDAFGYTLNIIDIRQQCAVAVGSQRRAVCQGTAGGHQHGIGDPFCPSSQYAKPNPREDIGVVALGNREQLVFIGYR